MHSVAEGRIFNVKPGGIYGYQWARNGYVKGCERRSIREMYLARLVPVACFSSVLAKSWWKLACVFVIQSSSVTVKIKGKVASLMPDLLLDYTDTDTKWLDLFQVIVTIIHVVQPVYVPIVLNFPGKLLILLSLNPFNYMCFVSTYWRTEPSHGQLVVGLSPRRIWFNSRPFSLGFMVGKVLLRGYSLQVLQFSIVTIIPPRLPTHSSISDITKHH